MKKISIAIVALTLLVGCGDSFDMNKLHIALEKANHYIEECRKSNESSSCKEAKTWTKKALSLREEYLQFDDVKQASLADKYGNRELVAVQFMLFNINTTFYNPLEK